MVSSNPQVRVRPEDDARLPILEAEIEREWRRWRRSYVKRLVAEGKLQQRVKETALDCVRILDEYQNRGLNPDQAREAIRALILPHLDQS